MISPIAPSQRGLADIAADLSSAHTGPASAAASCRGRAVPEAPSEGTDSSSPIPSREEPVSRTGRPARGRDHVSVTMPLSQMKTLKSQQGGELFSLLPFPRSQPQRYSSLDERNREAPKPTSKRSDRRDRELHSDSYRRSCSSRLRVVISIKGFDSPFVRTTTPALEDGANTTAARKPGFSPL